MPERFPATMTWFRRASILVSSIILGAGLYSAPAHAEELPVLGGGMKVTTNGTGWCSMGSVGYDDNGRMVGLIAGHCMTEPGAPVMLCANQVQDFFNTECGEDKRVLGHYSTTTISSGYDTTTNEIVDWTLDYAVIELDPAAVTLTNMTPHGLAINKIGPHPKVLDTVCKDGSRTGKSCGPAGQVDNNSINTWGYAWFGDSGSPALVGDGLVGFTSTLAPNVLGPFVYSGVHGALADIAEQGSDAVGIGFEPYTPAT